MANINNLFILIKEKGITAKKLSDDTGISTGNISDWKSGRSMPSSDKLEQLANYFNVSIDYLLGRIDNPSETTTQTESIKSFEDIKKALQPKPEKISFEEFLKSSEPKQIVNIVCRSDDGKELVLEISKDQNEKIKEMLKEYKLL